MRSKSTVLIDNMVVPIDGERNLLEVIRKAKIELPTFCYHSEMSSYGACRLCMVEVEGKGLQSSCSILPTVGMVVNTNTAQLRTMRKMIVELMLASHQGDCPTCSKGENCQLQKLGQRMGIKKVRFQKKHDYKPVDNSSVSLVKDSNKCVLCGDCVRMCNEIQNVGAIDFAYRGSNTQVIPCFNRKLGEVECVNCGQCARVCPTGALTPKFDVDSIWKVLHDPKKHVVAQIAPAVRVALGEAFGMEAGTITTGRIVAALRRIGFNNIYDTSFAADLTIMEEGTEFLTRYSSGKNIPQFTSCCPGWVKYVEQYYSDFIPNLSSCRSPQQMLGSICKKDLVENKNIDPENLVMVAIMPCTAKKFEANRPEFVGKHGKDVDFVMTTQELELIIKESGICFEHLDQESFDNPFGFVTGGGVIFGNSGGVSEAVLRYASEIITGKKSEEFVFDEVRGDQGIKEVTLNVENTKLRLAVVSGLGNAHKVMEQIKSGEKQYDFVEVMACPGGCINGGGQPVNSEWNYKEKRTNGLYNNDKMLQLHKSQENPYINELYEKLLIEPGSPLAHELLHTNYNSRKRIESDGVRLSKHHNLEALEVTVCFGTSCFIKGAQDILKKVTEYVAGEDISEQVEIKATFCYEKCNRGPVVTIGNRTIEKCTPELAIKQIKKQLVKVR